TLDGKLTPISILQLTAVEPTSRDELVITFTGFDEKSGSATVVADNGSAQASFFSATDHAQLIEITPAKNVATATITTNGQDVRVVYTRHMAMFDGGIISVYSGPCRRR